MAVSPLDCMGCGVCVSACPARTRSTMVPPESELPEQDVFDYCVAKVAEKPEAMQANTVKGSQFKQPLLEFSGSCAGCAETSYARLDHPALRRPHVHLQRHRLLLHLGRPGRHLSVHRQQGAATVPAWANSLFEDNAEHGLGMMLGYKAVQQQARGRHQGSQLPSGRR